MKIVFSFILICINIYFHSQGHAQPKEWAPIGAKWYYSTWFAYGPNDVSYVTIESVGDTIINGKSCRKLRRNKNICDAFSYNPIKYTYSDSNHVFIYNEFYKNFYMLYNFNATIGDSWDFYLDSCYFIIKVDSIFYTIINQDTLKSWRYISLTKPYADYVINQIGGTGYMLPDVDYPCKGEVCDGEFPRSWRCYQDSEKSYKALWLNESCDYEKVGFGGENKVIQSDFIFPNPFSDKIIIRISNQQYTFAICNLLGTVLCKNNVLGKSGESFTIDTKQLHKGLYFIKIYNKQQSFIFKLIKIE